MSRIRAALAKLANGLKVNNALLARAQRRYKANRKRAFQAHNQQIKAQKAADKLRAQGHLKGAGKRDRDAARKGHIAYKNHLRAQHFLGVIKTLTQRIEGLKSAQVQYVSQLDELKKVKVEGNTATGGTRRHRLKTVALLSAARCAAGKRSNFYSQAGAWDVDHCITGESYGERSDCSSWVTSVYKSAGLADPNGERYTGGYTGTLVANGKQVSTPQPGDLVIYGPGTGHHVEMYVGPGNKTIGHGSAPVDPGVIDLFGDGDYRFFSYL